MDTFSPPLPDDDLPDVAPKPVEAMAEVIVLSDDDDVPQITAHITAPRSPMVPRTESNQVKSNQATVHVANGAKLNMEQLGIKRLAEEYQKNQNAPDGNVSRARAQIQHMPRVSVPAATIHKMALENVIRRSRPNLPEGALSQVTPSTSRTRNNNNAMNARSFYKGYYMFEATEGYEPSRRSTRNNCKKIDGKFVCSYNPSGCYKLCSDVVELINHVWSHAVNDPPPAPAPRKLPSTGNLLYSVGSETILATNSKLAEKRMRICQYCNTEFSTLCQKQEHIITCHIEMDHVDTVCNICEIDCQNGIKLKNHMETHLAGEAPYNCKKCKYRTSVRNFFYQHYMEKHSNDALLCPICLYIEDLRPSTRRSKHIFVRTFIEHIRRHSTAPQLRCDKCALSFNDRDDLAEHRVQDHTPLNMLWHAVERRKVQTFKKRTISKKNKISLLQKQYLETFEGRRVADEVACKGGLVERMGFDQPTKGDTLFKCACGFNSYNGNRAASHYHRCRKAIVDIERDRRARALEKDPKDEMRIFAVHPPFTMTEKESRAERVRSLDLDHEDPYKLQLDEIEFAPQDDILLMKMVAKNNVDRSDDIIADCVANLVDSDDD